MYKKKLVACNIYSLRLVLCLTERLFDVCEEHKKKCDLTFYGPYQRPKKVITIYIGGPPFKELKFYYLKMSMITDKNVVYSPIFKMKQNTKYHI